MLGTGSGLLEQNSVVFLGLCLAFFAGPNTWRTPGKRNQRYMSIRHDVDIIFMNFISCTIVPKHFSLNNWKNLKFKYGNTSTISYFCL